MNCNEYFPYHVCWYWARKKCITQVNLSRLTVTVSGRNLERPTMLNGHSFSLFASPSSLRHSNTICISPALSTSSSATKVNSSMFMTGNTVYPYPAHQIWVDLSCCHGCSWILWYLIFRHASSFLVGVRCVMDWKAVWWEPIAHVSLLHRETLVV